MMLRKLAAVVAVCLCSCAVPCGELEGNVTLGNSQDVTRFACYSSITGSLVINTTTGPTNCELPFLEFVGRDLEVVLNYEMNELSLPEFKIVRGNFEFVGNEKIKDMSGLGKLEEVTGDMRIGNSDDKDNAQLHSLSGLEKLKKVGGNILIEYNPALPTCEAENLIAHIDDVGGQVTIQNNGGTGSCD